MKFFQSKKKITTRDFRAKAEDPAAALKEELDAAIVPALKSKGKTADEITEADAKVIKKAEPVKKAAGKSSTDKAAEDVNVDEVANAKLAGSAIENMRLFPGFEDQPFEIGYAAYAEASFGLEEKTPMLLVRWKTEQGETDWFPIPPMFNKVMLARIHERDHDLDRLLLDYGYDADQLTTSRKSEQ